jgi:hypothetical protein
MTWLAPWAFAGLALLAVPILVHLFARRRTRVLPFPTLRFIAPSRLLPVRTLRLSDPLLLAVRCAILVAAVLALAQPRFRTDASVRAPADALARVIVVDTSASMRRALTEGGTPVATARTEAARLAGEAAVGMVVETAAPAAALRGAAEWLRHQTGRREIAVISDFQLGTLDSLDLAAVPPDIGLAFARIGVEPATDGSGVARIGDGEVTVRAVVSDTATDASWTVRASAPPAVTAVTALAGADEEPAAHATLAAALRFAPPPADSAHAVAIVFPRHSQRAALERTARPPDAAWMGDVAAAVWEHAAVTRAGVASVDGRERLLLFTDAAPGTVEAAALALAAAAALGGRTPAAEREPAALPDARLETWRRPAGTVDLPADDTGDSDGRWLWLLALALLGAETLLRRPRRAGEREAVEDVEERHERVA